MLFEDQFTDFRDFIATVSHSIVQDDTVRAAQILQVLAAEMMLVASLHHE